jgi:DNA-binding MarR family transcriptional regulator
MEIKPMRIRRMSDGSFVDQDTGEVLSDEKYVFLAVPLREKIKEDWLMTFQDALEVIAKDRDLRGEPRAVLDYLMSKLSFDNYIAVEQSVISIELVIHKSNVSKSIKMLVEKGILEKGPRLGKSCSYKLNPFFGWKGRVKNLKDERKKRLSVIDGGKD